MKTVLKTFCIFIVLTATGTVLHEIGHCIAFKWYGYTPTLSYQSAFYTQDSIVHATHSVHANFIIYAVGGLSNMLIGTVGFIFCLICKDKVSANKLILLVSMAFFWSRQVVIFIGLLFANPQKARADELYMAKLLGLPNQLFSITYGLIGAAICTYCVFVILPQNIRWKFVVGGAAGALAGSVIWFRYLGPILLP